jgi:hypothetical protein
MGAGPEGERTEGENPGLERVRPVGADGDHPLQKDFRPVDAAFVCGVGTVLYCRRRRENSVGVKSTMPVNFRLNPPTDESPLGRSVLLVKPTSSHRAAARQRGRKP